MIKFRTQLQMLKMLFTRSVSGQRMRYAAARSIFNHLPFPYFVKNSIRNVAKRLIRGFAFSEYQEWIRCHDTLTDHDRQEILQHIDRLTHYPMISIIMPVYNTPEEILNLAIQSVQKQLYPHWELCIADDHSSDPQVRIALEKYANIDPRIKVIFRESNGHISAASNSALELATGEYIALMDHDDELAEHALYWIVTEIINHPGTMLVYTDEDKINIHGERSAPFFKPDWNPDLLLGQNYICHLGVYQRERVVAIGGFREGFEGSQDWELILRFTEGLPADAIRHIPAILYHWRTLPNSTSSSITVKPYSLTASRRAVTEALQRRLGNQTFILEDAYETISGHFLPRFTVKDSPLVSIIIPTRNGLEFLRPCIESIDKTVYKHYEIVIIDNQSNDPKTLEYLTLISQHSNIRVLHYNCSFNYAAMHNWAVPQVKGEYLCLLNNDTQVITPHWLEDMLALAQRNATGAVGAKLLYPDRTVQHNGVILGLSGIADHISKGMPSDDPGYYGRGLLLQNLSAVTAACLLVKKAHWIEIGGMVSELTVGFNDVDFCLRLQEKGLFNVWTPQAILYHYESKSRGHEIGQEKQLRFSLECAYMQWRWGRLLQRDPGYNINFCLMKYFTISRSPRRIFPWRKDTIVIDVPFGNPWAKTQPMILKPNGEMRGTFMLPQGLQGELVGMGMLVKIQGGQYLGTITLTVHDEGKNVAQGQATLGSEVKYNEFLPILFSNSLIPLHGQEKLHFCLLLKETIHPLELDAHPLNQKWGHGIHGHEHLALRLILYTHCHKSESPAS